MADSLKIKAIRLGLTLTFLIFACSSEDTISDAGPGDTGESGLRLGAGGAEIGEETSVAGSANESSPSSGAGGLEGSAKSDAGAADGNTGLDADDSTGSTGADSSAVPSVDAGDSGSIEFNPADSSPGDQKWTGPYANVVAVSASGDPGNYSFNVSIESSDIDCSQYASWWEVLTEEGALIFRRILAHPHTDENGTSDPGAPGNTFTRSGEPIDIEADEVVIVRAHMNTGGYHGDVLRGSVASGFSAAPDIDVNFAAEVEFEEPQPEGCREM